MKLLRILTLLLAVLALPLSAQAKIFLADTDDTLRVVTASGVSTIHMYAAWADITTTALTPGASDAQVTTATTTVIVAAPAASTYRQIKGLSIRNSHASSSNAITVEFYDGATATELIKYTLLAGETLQWGEDENFRVIDASGQVKGAVVADTEMPAAAALADNTANPTVPAVGAYMMCYDGSTWDRCITSPNIAHDADASSANPLLIGCYSSAAAPTDVTADTENVRAWCLRNGARAVQQTFAGVLATTGAGNTGTGVQRVIEATDSQLSAGVGATGDAAATAGSTGSLNAKQRLMTSQLADILTALQLIDNDQTGASVHYRTSAGSTEDEHEVKATAGRLFSITATNTNAAARYLRCSNLTAANTTPGTSTVFLGVAIPGATAGAGITFGFGPKGIAFSTALTCWLVTGAADTDVAEVAANEIKVVYAYE